MTQTKILVVYGSSHSETEHRAFMSAVTALTDLVGVHLIVVREGQSADAVLNRSALADRDTCDRAANIKAGLRRCSEIRNALHEIGATTATLCIDLGDAASSHAQPEPAVAAIQGKAISFMLDPLEQAIESTVRMMRDEHQQMTEVGAKEDTALCDRLGSHLDALLAIQIERVTADETV